MSAENEIRNIKLFEEEIRNIKQMAFDAAHPVGETYTQYPQQDDPMTLYNKNGVTSVWQQQTQYSGAFFRSSNAPEAVYKNDDETDYYILDSVTGELIAIQAASSGGPTIADSPSGESIWYKGKEYKRYVVTASTRYANNYIDKTNSLSIQNQSTAKNGLTLSKSGRAYGNSQTITGGSHSHSMLSIEELHDGNSYIYGSGYGSKNTYLSTSSESHSHTFTPSVSDNISYSISGDTETRPNNYTYIIWKRIS